MPLQLTEKTEENKESVSSSNLTSFNTTSHPNVKSQIVEAVYTKCIAQLRNICTRMKLPITVTIHAVSLLHRYLLSSFSSLRLCIFSSYICTSSHVVFSSSSLQGTSYLRRRTPHFEFDRCPLFLCECLSESDRNV